MALVQVLDRVPKDALTSGDLITPAFGSRYMQRSVAKYQIPDHEMPSQIAYQIIHDELATEVHPLQNLGSFVTTWMEPEADKLMKECRNKNLVDIDQYPMVHEINARCVAMMADLLNGSKSAFGTTTLGSSEACMLAGLAMKLNWKERVQKSGRNPSQMVPNIILSRSTHFVWTKFCTLFDVEGRYVNPMANNVKVNAKAFKEYIDEGTIGIVAVMGTTLTGHYEPIKELNDLVAQIHKKGPLQIPIHVDAAIGGFFAPFVDPSVDWDFRLDNVCSINVSGHKFGLVYPGVGFLLFRSPEYCSEKLRFRIDYLGTESQEDMCLNFSRSAAPVVAQFYNFIRLGREGYGRIMSSIRANAEFISEAFHNRFGDGLKQLNDPSSGLPVVVLTSAEGSDIPVATLSKTLRQRGWTAPTYQVPFGDHHIDVLRIVVRESLSRDQAELLLKAVQESIDEIRKAETLPGAGKKAGYRASRKRKAEGAEGHDEISIKHSIC